MSTKWRSWAVQAANRSSKRGEVPRIAGARPELPAGPRIAPVVQRELQDLGQVEVAGEDVRLLAVGAGLHAAAGAALARVLDALALAQQLGHDAVRVEQRRVAVALAHHAAGLAQEVLRGDPRQLDVGAGLDQVQLVDDLEQQVRHLAHAVGAVAPHAAEGDAREVRVGPALGGRDAHLGRRGVVVELDEQAAQELLRLPRGSGCRPRSRAGRTAPGAGPGAPASRRPSR